MTESAESAPQKSTSWSDRLFGDSHALRLMTIAVLIFIVFSILLPGKFFSIRNMQSMAVQFPEFGILAFAIMITMLTGGIDLSIVGTANLAAIFAALTMTRLAGDGGAGLSPVVVLPLSAVVAYAAGSLCGLFNGFLVARIGITPILATLGTMSLYTGLGYVITGGPAITTTQLSAIGNGNILGAPIPVLVFVLVAMIFAIMLNRTTFGFNVYMLGTNPVAARFSGINTSRVLMRTYWISGMVATTAGIIFLSRANSAKPDYGGTFVLLSVLIAILGGVSYTGGSGTVAGVVLAVLCLQFLSTGLNMYLLENVGSSASIFFRQFAWGALLLLVMVYNVTVERRRAKRISAENG